MDTYGLPVARREHLIAALNKAKTATSEAGTVNRRRSWSRVEKGRIVAEAFRPGASVADVARRHGLNANQVFNWRRRIQARSSATAQVATPAGSDRSDTVPAMQFAGFMPVGVVVPTDGEPAATASSPLGAPATLDRARLVDAATGGRVGILEIELACGTRLLVDAFINERALRRHPNVRVPVDRDH